MNLFIPPLGTTLVLAEDWEFDLYDERRNDSLAEVLGITFDPTEHWSRRNQKPRKITIPAGAQLKVDRIYIRKGQNGFDSVSFLWLGEKTKSKLKELWSGHTYKVPARGVRFWAKLDDVNRIVCASVLPPEKKAS